MDAFNAVRAYTSVAVSLPRVTHDRRKVRRRLVLLRWATVQLAVFALALAGCDRAPAEHDGAAARPTSEEKAPALSWTVPAGWTLDKSAASGTYRAKYVVPRRGEAKHDAEVLVQRLGPGTKAKVDAQLDVFLNDFEGTGLETVRRETLEDGPRRSFFVELDATYRFPMGPRVKGRPAASVIKEDWSGIAAGVMTPEGNWLFTMVGPRETVHGARAEFREMIASLR
jgi:hypothetical protein